MPFTASTFVQRTIVGESDDKISVFLYHSNDAPAVYVNPAYFDPVSQLIKPTGHGVSVFKRCVIEVIWTTPGGIPLTVQYLTVRNTAGPIVQVRAQPLINLP